MQITLYIGNMYLMIYREDGKLEFSIQPPSSTTHKFPETVYLDEHELADILQKIYKEKCK